jgi:hypothetical protein
MVLLAFAGCDLFTTRDPENPTQQSSHYVPPTDAPVVLQNMMNSFQDANAVNYAKSFADSSFAFEATAAARNGYGSTFAVWDKNAEQQYFEKTVRRLSLNTAVSLSFDVYTTSNFFDSVQIEAVYHLTVPHTMANVTKKFNGRAQFLFVRSSNGLFSIRKWIDVGLKPTDSTWSDLKGISSTQW